MNTSMTPPSVVRSKTLANGKRPPTFGIARHWHVSLEVTAFGR